MHSGNIQIYVNSGIQSICSIEQFCEKISNILFELTTNIQVELNNFARSMPNLQLSMVERWTKFMPLMYQILECLLQAKKEFQESISEKLNNFKIKYDANCINSVESMEKILNSLSETQSRVNEYKESFHLFSMEVHKLEA